MIAHPAPPCIRPYEHAVLAVLFQPEPAAWAGQRHHVSIQQQHLRAGLRACKRQMMDLPGSALELESIGSQSGSQAGRQARRRTGAQGLHEASGEWQ